MTRILNYFSRFNRFNPPPATPYTSKEYAGGYPAALLRPCLEQGESDAPPLLRGGREGFGFNGFSELTVDYVNKPFLFRLVGLGLISTKKSP